MAEFNVLVCGDDREIVEALGVFLKNEGYGVFKAHHGQDALALLSKEKVHLVLLDIMMPGLDGLKTTTKIREEHNIPIILVSAKSEDTDKILGLHMGADDYVTKPFNPMEVLARVKSHLRRYVSLGQYQDLSPGLLKTGGLTLDTDKKEVCVDGECERVTPTEFKILKLMMEHMGKVFPMDEIYEAVWNEPSFSIENTVAVHIRRIREKIEINPKEPKYLKVVWGIGYKVEKLER